nr:helix-turn-helix domain-containing protein [uncultured Devosia sp.]
MSGKPTMAYESVHKVLSLAGELWTVPVITALRSGKQRFGDLRRNLPGISQKPLSRTLKQLERDGYVLRDYYPTIPPRVEYELTDLGLEFLTSIAAVAHFSIKHRHEIDDARQSYDQNASSALNHASSAFAIRN